MCCKEAYIPTICRTPCFVSKERQMEIGPKDLGRGIATFGQYFGYYGQTEIREDSCSGEVSRNSGVRKGLSHSEGLEHPPSRGHKIPT